MYIYIYSIIINYLLLFLLLLYYIFCLLQFVCLRTFTRVSIVSKCFSCFVMCQFVVGIIDDGCNMDVIFMCGYNINKLDTHTYIMCKIGHEILLFLKTV